MLPGVVEDARVEIVPLHASFEKAQTRAIVWLLLELERPAVFHELSELARVPATKLLQTRLYLFLLNVIVQGRQFY